MFGLSDTRQQNGLSQHVVDLVETHPDTLEHLHCLPPEEAMPHPINLRERPLAEETFNLVGAADDLAVF